MAPPLPIIPVDSPLHERVRNAIRDRTELPSIEFKAGCPFAKLKGKILRTVQGMANLPGGGLILVGIDEVSPAAASV